jgi:hypothetical protein
MKHRLVSLSLLVVLPNYYQPQLLHINSTLNNISRNELVSNVIYMLMLTISILSKPNHVLNVSRF